MSSTTKTRYCQCGAAAIASSTPPELAEGVVAAFDELHTGDGHGPATARQARAARAKANRLALEGHHE